MFVSTVRFVEQQKPVTKVQILNHTSHVHDLHAPEKHRQISSDCIFLACRIILMGTTKFCLLVLVADKLLAAAMSIVPHKPHIMCVGLATIDFVATVDHFPEPDEKMRSSSLTIEGGGNAANTACAMGRLAPLVDVTLVTGVGDDANGVQIVESIQNDNVQVLAERYLGNSPFSYILNTNVNGENTRTSIHQPASGDMLIDFVKNLSLNDVSAVHFDCRYPTASVALARRCVDLGIPYSVDVERPREGLLEILQGPTVVICNSNYCNTILGLPSSINKDKIDYRIAAHRLRSVMLEQAPNAMIAVVTLGSKGSCLIKLKEEQWTGEAMIPTTIDDEMNAPTISLQGNCLYCSAFSNVDVVDSTGAGDAFIGGLLTALWMSAIPNPKMENPRHGWRLSTNLLALATALRVASRVASRKLEQPGARRGLPTKDDPFISSELERLMCNTVMD